MGIRTALPPFVRLGRWKRRLGRRIRGPCVSITLPHCWLTSTTTTSSPTTARARD